MIDTDKYTGHTLAEHWDFSIWGITMPTGFDADARLIADAPLLLAEVKRLQAWKQLVSGIVQQQDGPHLREMLKELTE
tara:strand:+ start:4724 stop:4957 length:234 start_codon:yes stop_codon:yes gene_type:complete